MKNTLRNITYFTLVTVLAALSAQAQIRAYRVGDRQVKTVIARIEARTDAFKNAIDDGLDNSTIDGTRREDFINTTVADFEQATNRLKDNFDSRRSTSADVQDVLNKAAAVNSIVISNRVSRNTRNQWNLLRRDLNTLAGYYRVSGNWSTTPVQQTQFQPYRVTDDQVKTVIARIETRTDAFKNTIDNSLDNSNIDGTRREDFINITVADFEQATNRLRDNFDSRRSTSADVQDVLNKAAAVNSIVVNNRVSRNTTNQWNLLRQDLNTLAGFYRVSGNWSTAPVEIDRYSGSFDARLTGTYRLNSGQSDDVSAVVERAIRSANYSNDQQDRMRRNLERRLVSPETLSFDKRGQQVTFGSANMESVVLTANGVKQTETSPNGRSMTTSVTANNRDLTINYEGDRLNDYNVSFMPAANGQLVVTRRIYLENQNTTVMAKSVYDKISQSAQFYTPAYPSNNGNNYPSNNEPRSVNGFIIPNNTNIIATLDSILSTKTVNDGDRFSMTVTSPSQYNGAIIEGTVDKQRSGVISGRATISLNFQTIRMRDGRTSNFAGIVEQVRDSNGGVIEVNNEGTVRDSSQTNKTVARAGIGALLGGIIGAIAGGGSGAAIGAGVGAGAGAGTVVLQGRDNLDLERGSQFTITATGPGTR